MNSIERNVQLFKYFRSLTEGHVDATVKQSGWIQTEWISLFISLKDHLSGGR